MERHKAYPCKPEETDWENEREERRNFLILEIARLKQEYHQEWCKHIFTTESDSKLRTIRHNLYDAKMQLAAMDYKSIVSEEKNNLISDLNRILYF